MTKYPIPPKVEKQEHPYKEKKARRKQLLEEIEKRRAEVYKRKHKR